MTPPRRRITYGKTIWHSVTIVLQWLLAILLATILLFNGAADAASRPAFGIGFAGIALLVLLVPFKNTRTRPLLRRALLLCLGTGLWSVLQALPLPLWMPVHPVWQDLSATLGTTYGVLFRQSVCNKKCAPEPACSLYGFCHNSHAHPIQRSGTGFLAQVILRWRRRRCGFSLPSVAFP